MKRLLAMMTALLLLPCMAGAEELVVSEPVHLIGYLPLASALVFDIGVYVTVFASALLMLSTMGTVKQRQQANEEAY